MSGVARHRGGYTQGYGFGQKARRSLPRRVKMGRLIKWIVIALLVVGTMFYLQSRVSEQPQTRVEKPVSLDALGK
jgi:hypothetical protein